MESRGRDFLIQAQLFRGARRKLFVNHVKLKTAGELSEILQTVLFCPEDLALIKAGAAERRTFLDRAICQLRPRYAEALSQYQKLLDHKTRILRDWEKNPSLLEVLEDFNEAMARAQGINTSFAKVLGLMISNGLVALSGALLAQYQAFPTSTWAVAPSSLALRPLSSAR